MHALLMQQDQALDALQENKALLLGRDLFDSYHSYRCYPLEDTVTTMESQRTPTSWKELAEIGARNRAAEQLANISEESGDAKSYEADDFEQFYSDTHRGLSDDYVPCSDEDYSCATQMKSIQMRLEL